MSAIFNVGIKSNEMFIFHLYSHYYVIIKVVSCSGIILIFVF